MVQEQRKVGLFAKILIALKKIWIVIILGIGGAFKGIIGNVKRKSKEVSEVNLNSDEIAFKDNPKADEISEISSTSID